ncbi:MAG: Rpn family recombination-promoting nuclease/putative transposase [Bacteroidales bacterium]|nr:Rpn family recombination-promoting nuclease/putative transposase [Bacteroidales bacterium]
MEKDSNCIRFDWAAKYILRDKADFIILEGFVSAILDEKITITELLESESNQKEKDDKYNRVDIKAKNGKGDIILIEIQQSTEHYFLQRVLFGMAKTITEHFKLGEHYNNVKKVYSINILYFDFGKGDDYLYHGYNTLVGVNTGDQLKVTATERQGIKTFLSEKIFPEYYILRVEKFDKEEAHSAREEWMRYLNCGYIDPNTTVHGLHEAYERLQELKMTVGERKAYEKHLENISYQISVLDSARIDGRIEGRAEGKNEAYEEIIERMRKAGLDEETIRQITRT